MGKGPGEESGLGPSEHERRGTPFEVPFFFRGVGDYFRRLFQYRTHEGGKSGHPPRLSTNQLEIRD